MNLTQSSFVPLPVRLVFLLLFCVIIVSVNVLSLSAQGNTFTVDTTNDTLDISPGNGICADSNGECSIRAAITEANNQPTASTIIIPDLVNDDVSVYTLSIAGDENANAGGDLDIRQSMTIQGAGSAEVIIDGDGTYPPFHLNPTEQNLTIFISGITIRNGAKGTNLVVVGGNTVAEISDAIITNTIATNSTNPGRGISNLGNLTVRNSIVTNNGTTNTAGGGGIYNAVAGVLTISHTIISNNYAGYNAQQTLEGGGIVNYGIMNLHDGTVISGNHVSDYTGSDGGGFHNAGQVVVQGTVTVSGNSLGSGDQEGAGLSNFGTIDIYGALIVQDNSSAIYGGGIYNSSNSIISFHNSGSVIENNSALYGGGIRNRGTIYIAAGNVIQNNTVSRSGGGISNEGTIVLDGVTIDGNTADGSEPDGAGIINSGNMTITNSTISGNQVITDNPSASDSGGGIYNSGSSSRTLTIVNSTISGNSAGYGAGLFSNTAAEISLNNVTITNNMASSQGGGLLADSAAGIIMLANTIVAGNSTGSLAPDCSNEFDNIVSNGSNLIGNTVTCGSPFVASDILNQAPNINPLADNGGSTETHSLQNNSPAIGNGNSATCDRLDQRNLLRGAVCDIGAFELDGSVPPPATGVVSFDVVTGSASESSGNYVVDVKLVVSDGPPDLVSPLMISVSYSGTASAGNDYINQQTDVMFMNDGGLSLGTYEATVSLDIANDTLLEGNETVIISLISSNLSVTVDPQKSVHTLTINDDESPTNTPTITNTPTATSTITPTPTATSTSDGQGTPIGTLVPSPTNTPDSVGANQPVAPRNLRVDVSTGYPKLMWDYDPNAQWFNIWIGGALGQAHYEWYPANPQESYIANQALVACNNVQCVLTIRIDLIGGDYQVWMQSWGTEGYSVGGNTAYDGWSTTTFALSTIAPGPVNSAAATVNNGDITLSWRKVEGATWYNVWLGTGSPTWTPLFFDWIHADDLVCDDDDICTLSDGVAIALGGVYNLNLPAWEYVWYVRSWGPGGFSTGGIPGLEEWVQGPDVVVP